MEQVDASIARYLATLDRADREESDITEANARVPCQHRHSMRLPAKVCA
jgi:hypothetical protein